jgi:hypothetical protein
MPDDLPDPDLLETASVEVLWDGPDEADGEAI